ncbi:hypothetical protein [Microbacterium sp. 2MCAF23]|uniref:hypothetical protein n=1 Tax=Microbacterium sp. 2MCAF23 TaxID=3232985 RepID=UPI003F94B65A
MNENDRTNMDASPQREATPALEDVARPAWLDTPRHPSTESSERSTLATHVDPSGATVPVARDVRLAPRTVSWVRPTELVARSGARAAGRGIDLHAELVRRFRAGAGGGLRRANRAISDRQRRLPDLSLGGRDYPTEEISPELSGISLR